jgi:D-3-phosphoglycerate dehydrogenase / 2-oxoglutarate reductase
MPARPVVIQCFPMMHPVGEEILGRHVELRTASSADPATVIREGQDARAMIGRSPARIGADVLDALGDLLVVSATGSGADWVDIQACRDRGIPVLHNPGVAPTPVTEYVLGAMVMVYKRLREADAFLRAGGDWEPKDRFRGRELTGKVLGVVGLGAIGGDVARRARAAFDMTVLAYDPGVRDPRFAEIGAERVDRIEALFERADVISLHLPLLPETRGLIDAAVLAHCRPGAVLVNASRGGVVDEAALVDVLRSGRLSGAATDVFDAEPPRADNPLFQMPNVVVTPHIAGLTVDATIKLSTAVAENVLAALRGERPPHIVNPEAWPPRRLDASVQGWPLAGPATV